MKYWHIEILVQFIFSLVYFMSPLFLVSNDTDVTFVTCFNLNSVVDLTFNFRHFFSSEQFWSEPKFWGPSPMFVRASDVLSDLIEFSNLHNDSREAKSIRNVWIIYPNYEIKTSNYGKLFQLWSRSWLNWFCLWVVYHYFISFSRSWSG